MPHPIPAGHHALTPHLIVKNAPAAIEFYKRAFGAEELFRMPFPDGQGGMKIGHATLLIGDSHLFLADEFPEYGSVGPADNSPVTIHLYVTDANAAYAQALEAGATVSMPISDTFWGNRYAKVVDPFGHHWAIAEHLEDLTPEQMQERFAASVSEPSCTDQTAGV